ncbi:Sec61_alpha family protein [Hexamita inflata]|uniref:Sec61 alpha family protein n=1 Tax=Hexamita inflata TaxID=28002 RepID=A0AA86RDC2_9EUKA|nr:Sec61 alpha family protein [Hexamita inflata]
MLSSWMMMIEPFTKLLPYVKKAPSSIQMRQKLFYTFLALLIYILGQQIPLFGMQSVIEKDPSYWLRQIFLSQRGTVMELGLGPTMTSQFVIRLLVQAGVLTFNRANEAETVLFGRVQQLVGAVFTLFQAVFHVIAGMYGSVGQLGFLNAGLIVFQLTFASVIMQTLDEMLENGWGVGQGSSLFNTASTCMQIVWKCLSFMKIDRGYGTEFEGAIPAAFHYIFTRESKLEAIKLAFIRQGLPNILNVVATVIVFCFVVWLQGFKKNLPIQHQTGGKMTQRQFPIKLLYASSTPMMIIQQISSTLHMFSQALWKKTGNNILTAILGTFQENEQRPGQVFPTGGLVWIMAPPYSLRSAFFHPLHTILHTCVMVFMSGLVSKLWIGFSGESAAEQAKQLLDNQWIITALRPCSVEAELNKYIPTAAVTGGIILGLLSLVADVFGTLGSGSGLLMAATALVKIYEDFAKEQLGW